MTLIRYRIQALAGTAAVLALIHIAPARPETLPSNVLHIERWPEDVPCSALKRYPDGTWEITVPYELYYTVHKSTKFKGLKVTEYWERKCRK